MTSVTKKFELFLWAILPGLITLFLSIICMLPKHIAGLAHFMPLLPMMPIFYWGMVHAREMPYWFVFAIGLLMDAVTGLPLGLTSLLNVFFLALLHAQRKYIRKEGFVIKWGYFALLMAVISSLNWLLLSLYYSQSQGFQTAVIQWIMTIGCYPLLHKCFDVIQEFMNTRRWQLLHGR